MPGGRIKRISERSAAEVTAAVLQRRGGKKDLDLGCAAAGGPGAARPRALVGESLSFVR